MIDGQLLTKNGIAVFKLIKEFILMKPGDRINTVGEYAESLNLGRGTIQGAMKYLEEIEAIEFEVKGHLGTYIHTIDYKKLLEITGQNIITGVMPLPYSKRYEGLATGLYNTFDGKDISFNMAYMRGGINRLEALKLDKYDFAVVSKLTSDYSVSLGFDIDVIMELGKYSYVNGHKVIFADPTYSEIESGMKIALDESSIDHSLLTKYECEGKNVKFINFSYSQIFESLIEKKIDAAVWNIDEIKDRGMYLKSTDLKNIKSIELDEDDTKAVIIVKKSSNAIKRTLLEIIDKNFVLKVQNEVLKGNIMPNY